MEFCLATEKDRRQVEGLWGYCFEPPDNPFFQWYFSRSWQPADTLCGFEQGGLTCCVHLNPYTMQLRDTVQPVTYIVGLATAPAARRGGVAELLLSEALQEMRRRRQFFTVLMPSQAGFYYPFGWELCYHQLKYRLEMEDLRRLASREGEFRMLTGTADWSCLADVYNRFVAGRHGYAVRKEAEWHRLMESHQAENGHIAVLYLTGQPAGYMLYHVRDNTFMVGDMAFTGWQARCSLLGFIYNHRSSAQYAEWNSPLDDTLHFALPNPKHGISLLPFMSGRVVDVSQGLMSLTYPRESCGQLRLAVYDHLAEWNNGTFEVCVADGRATVRSSAQSPDVTCSVGALALLVFGRLSARELADAARLTTVGEKTLDTLDAWFPVQKNYINEYF